MTAAGSKENAVEGVPVFPLHAVAFPGVDVPLRVFESRYKRLIDAAMAKDGRFVIALIDQGVEAGGPLPQPRSVGTLVDVDRIDYRGPELQLVVRGVARVATSRLRAAEGYLVADVAPLASPEVPAALTPTLSVLRSRLGRVLSRIQDVQGDGAKAVIERLESAGDLEAAYLAATVLPMEMAARQRLLEANDLAGSIHEVANAVRKWLGDEDPAYV